MADGNLRDLALFSTAIDTMLRGVDLLALTVADVTDREGQIREEFTVRQQKTCKWTLVKITPYTQKMLAQWIAKRRKLPWQPLFTRLRSSPGQALSTRYYRTLVKKWVDYAHLDPAVYGSHSLRRTKAALIYEQTRNIEVVHELLGQSTVTATLAYLDIRKRRALEIASKVEIVEIWK